MKKLLIFFLLFAASYCSHAQDFTFSQFYDVPLYRNPAFAGVFYGNIRATGVFRSQWSSVTVPYETKGGAVETAFPVGFSGDMFTVGFQFARDMAGDANLGRTHCLPVFSYHKALDDHEVSYLIAGFQGGLVQSQFDPTKLRFGSQFFSPGNPVIIDRTLITYLTGSAGLLFTSELGDGSRYYWGFAGYNLLRSKVNFYDNDNVILKPRYVINSGIDLLTGGENELILSGDMMIQGGNRQLIVGAMYYHYWRYDRDNFSDRISLAGGFNYRWADALIPTARIVYRKLSVGLSYDINISKLKAASQFRGGFEATLGYVDNLNALKSRRQKERGRSCEQFKKFKEIDLQKMLLD